PAAALPGRARVRTLGGLPAAPRNPSLRIQRRRRRGAVAAVDAAWPSWARWFPCSDCEIPGSKASPLHGRQAQQFFRDCTVADGGPLLGGYEGRALPEADVYENFLV